MNERNLVYQICMIWNRHT